MGDTGTLDGWTVRNTRKESGTVWHEVAADDAKGLDRAEAERRLKSYFGKQVVAKVDADRRRRITRNHSATHLLHFALRSVLGKHVTQAGSLVAPDHLRFDFTHGKAMTPDEIAEVERIVNDKALAGDPVDIQTDVPIAEAKKMGAMALFGEKYGDAVRVVKMGESIELCGGCHVRNTSEVGLFKIVSESSAASGVRRIEAITGEASVLWVREQTEKLKEAAALLKAQPADLVPAVHRTLEALKDEKRRVEKLRSQGSGGQEAASVTLGSVELVRSALHDAEQQDAAAAADRLADGHPNRVVLVGLAAEGKASFIAKVGAQAQAAGVHAGNLVREVAKIAGGGGGGRADFATAGGKDPCKLDEALAAAEGFVRGMLKQ